MISQISYDIKYLFSEVDVEKNIEESINIYTVSVRNYGSHVRPIKGKHKIFNQSTLYITKSP